MAITMEELRRKAKAYDKVVGKLKQFMAQGVDPLITRADVQDFFPELKESDDERVRKELIELIGCMHDADPRKKGWITWLEKKDELDEAKAKRILINKGYPIDANSELPTYEDMYSIIKDGLEKQNESIDINPSEFDLRLNKLLKQFDTLPKDELASSLAFYLNVIENDGTYVADKKQGESKIDDNTEPKDYNSIDPKFHEGDWIVWQDKFYKVNYNGCGYELIDQNGLCTSLEYGTVEESAHLWTIQDAKDGDVLYCDNGNNKTIYLFKEQRGLSNIANTHFQVLNMNNELRLMFNKAADFNSNTKPATKEQSDNLMKAMADAGWEFDFEKKELKKLGQQCEVPVTINIDKMVMDYTNECGNDGFGKPLNCMIRAYRQGLTDAICTLTLANKKTTDKVEQEPTKWTEEDEEMLDFCCDYLDTPHATWLQTLKQRIGG